MKCVRILVLLLATGMVAIFSVPASAQFEIDPDHFDQVGKVKASGDVVKNQTTRKTSETKHQQKHLRTGNRHSEGTRQAKAVNQPLPDGTKGE